MPPLYEQRSLISQNVSLIQRWLALLPTEDQRNVIESMVRRSTARTSPPKSRQEGGHPCLTPST